jgi:thiamine biosynthesis lipoprotein
MSDKKKKLRWQLPFLTFLIVGTIIILGKQDRSPYHTNQGMVFGTVYKITYQYAEDLQADIKAELEKVNASLSPFQKQSIISRINNNDPTVMPDSMFLHVFQLAKAISADTHGAFDITVAPLVNAWGFGFESSLRIDSLTIDSLRQYVGMANVFFDGEQIIKTDSCVKLDCSAIAKGYGCDAVAALFDSKGIRNYMVEIGGELVVKGINSKRNKWGIGINKPIEDSLAQSSELQTIVRVSDIAMATSGNYRNYYYRDGKKYAHTIDPRTGYPVAHSLLSATVLAPDATLADAYATYCMVIGLDESKDFIMSQPDLEACLIYDEGGDFKIWTSPGFQLL